MSRVRQEIASVQFQVDARNASAAMTALQGKADELNKAIKGVNEDIAKLGTDVPKDHPGLIAYNQQLKVLDKQLKDVKAAMRDYVKGVKAADQLYKAAQIGDIEGLSFRSIKAGQNGLRRRMEGLSPGSAEDMKEWRAYKAVIEEADRVVKDASADITHTIQMIQQGGKVSEQTMRRTRDALKELMSSVEEGTAEYRTYSQQFDFMNGKIDAFAVAQRRAKGEMIDANDARREMLKLTEEGRRQAEFQRNQADWEVRFYQQENQLLEQKRQKQKAAIDQTDTLIDRNERLIEAEHAKIAEAEKNILYNEEEDRKSAERLRRRAEAAKQEADQLDATARREETIAEEKHARAEQLKGDTKEYTKAMSDYQSAQEKASQAQTAANQKQVEAMQLDQQAESMEYRVAHAEEDRIKALDHMSQKLNGYIAEEQRLLTTKDAQQKQLDEIDRKMLVNANGEADAQAKKAQAQELTIKRMEDMLALLRKEYNEEATNAEQRKKLAQDIQQLEKSLGETKGEAALNLMTDRMRDVGALSKSALEETKKFWQAMADGADKGSRKLDEAKAHVTALAEEERKRTEEAMREVLEKAQNGDYDKASMSVLDDAIKKLKAYQALIQDPNGLGADTFTTTKEQIDGLTAQLNALKGVAEKVTGTFASADEVLERFAEHMNGGKQASESMAQTLDEKLAGKTSSWDDRIKEQAEYLEDCTRELEEYEKELQEYSNQLTELEQKHSKRSWLWKKINPRHFQGEEREIAWLRRETSDNYYQDEEGHSFITQKGLVDNMREYKQNAQDRLTHSMQMKAKELGLADEEVAAEEKKQQARKLTNAEMQEGIKLLEQEFAMTDHTTDEGIKRRSELRSVIDQMNQEIKESTGEWMTYAEAEKYASQAGTSGFIATGQQMQQAVQALERRRDALIKNIQKQKDANQATADEETQLKKVEAELKRIKFEMDHAGMSAKRMEEILNNPNVANNIEELGMAVKRSQAQLKLMEATVGKSNEAYIELAKKTQLAAQRQKELEQQFKASTSSFEKAWSRLKTYVTLYVSAAAAIQKMTSSMSDLLELSDKMGEVRKTTGFTADEVAHLSENLKGLDVRTNIVQLLEISASAGQLGLKTIEDVEGFTIAANKLMIALPEMGKEAATEMMRVAIATGEVDKIRKQLEEGTVEGSNATAVAMEKIASTIDRLRASSASTAPEITDFVKRLGAVGAQSGISIDQISALGSTVSSLGMRVEMSATALSRMIPAIKNNAFEVAKAIKVEPAVLRNLFETGRGMEAILMIFQHIKDAGMDEDSIEKLLGMSGMQDVMKQLNQQGARAGIVFAGLSQNVDELRKQLGIAAQAYEENIAIQQEFDRMNETTAAKWERFKNEIEEALVRDQMQRFIGGLIDGLRSIANLLTGNVSPALQIITGLIHTLIAYFTVLKVGLGEALFVKSVNGFKAMKTGLMGLVANTKEYLALSRQLRIATAAEAAAETAAAKATAAHNVEVIKTTMAQKGLNKAMIANIWTAVAAAIITASLALYNWIQNLREAAREAGRFEAEAQKNIRTANKMIDAIGKARVKVEDAEVAVRKARKELEAAKEANDGTAEAVKRLKDAETELLVQEEKKRIAMAEHKRLIEQFNGQYSKYLGFMLSEVSSNLELAKARDLVNSKLRETITLKQQEAGLERVERNMGEKRDEKYGFMQGKVQDLIKDPTKAARVMQELTKASQKDYKSLDEFTDEVLRITKKNNIAGNLQPLMNSAKKYYLELKDIKKAQDAVVAQAESDLTVRREDSQKNLVSQVNEAFRTYNKHLRTYKSAEGDNRAQAAAAVLQQMDQLREMQQSASSYYKMDNKEEEARYKRQMGGIIGWQGYNREELLKAAGKYYTPRKDVNGEITSGLKDETNGGWGKEHEASSTDWANMTAEQLVNRRKQMKEFVNAIQTDSDVQSVLGEDAALKKAIENGMSSDMRTVIEWYNTERLKIQDELHARHLTNTGDWMDPKKQKNAHKQFQNEVKAYLEELDAYYTERNQAIQTARNNEEITEAEAWRRTIKNETEWYNRRAELQKLYGEKSAEVTQEEQDAIFAIIAERTGDSEKFIQQMIGKTIKFAKDIEKSGEKGAAVVHKWRADLGLGWEKDFLKSAKAIGKQMKFIEDTLAKERPYDGITKNLQENLDKMGVLAAKYKRINDELLAQGKKPKYSDAEITSATFDEMAFFLKQAENAWSIDIDELLRRMAREGLSATADEISKSEMLKQAVMGQLRKTFEEVQNAVKKEASQIKKDVDIIWNDETMGSGGMSMKSAYDKAIAQLGMQQESVSRANSLIGAGAASDNVAARLAMKQIEMQMRMQKAQFDMYRAQAKQRIIALQKEAAEHKRIAEQMKQQGQQEEAAKERLKAAIALRDAENVRRSLGLTLAEETKKKEENMTNLLKLQEESQNRLYQSLREWADLLSSSVQSVMEASNAGNREYYNERAKMNLTGKGGPGAGTYIVIEDEGTSDAKAHYEYLDERAALERQHEIEQQNAQAEAWKKVMDDINMKMSEQITDWLNASMQSVAVDNNTKALELNTEALYATMGRKEDGTPATAAGTQEASGGDTQSKFAYDKSGGYPGSSPAATPAAPQPELTQNTDALQNLTTSVNTLTERLGGTGTEAPAAAPAESVAAAVTEGAGAALGLKTGEGGTDVPQQWPVTEEQVETIKTNTTTLWEHYADAGIEAMTRMGEETADLGSGITDPWTRDEEKLEKNKENQQIAWDGVAEIAQNAMGKITEGQKNVQQGEKDTENQMVKGSQSAFAKMASAANMYGIAYQTMSNDNLSTEQKFQAMALQMAGQSAIAMMQTKFTDASTNTLTSLPEILAGCLKINPIAGAAIFAVLAALLGAGLGVAASKLAKGKSEVSKVTGASASAGRLATGMMTYAKGNVNELTDPDSLTPGRHYNVDGADGKTYRAKYMGKNAKTHITTGPEFHLVGEKGQEAIIDAHTTRNIRLNEPEIWQNIQTLYNGGRLSPVRRRRGRGVPAFADGNLDDFEEITDGMETGSGSGIGADQVMQLQASLDRNSDVLERAMNEGIKGVFDVYNKGGLVDTYDTAKKNLTRHGERY